MSLLVRYMSLDVILAHVRGYCKNDFFSALNIRPLGIYVY